MNFEPIHVPPCSNASEDAGFVACAGGVCASSGILASGVSAGFRRNPHSLDLALVAAEKTCVAAATFTTNRFCAAPVTLSRERARSARARAVILNSGNANAATGEPGLAAAALGAELVAHELGCAAGEVLVGSTGVIGVPLPLGPYETGVPIAVAALASDAAAAHDAASAVMTTDTHAKEASFSGDVPQRSGGPLRVHVGGFAKGSGMIQPTMATMLAVLSTDAPLTPEAAHEALLAAVRATFNKVTVDSDTSTNDSCFLLATGSSGGEKIDLDHPAFPVVAAALERTCSELARQIAADGEGATKLVTVNVIGAADERDADAVARAIANSPLVKTAIFGHDANWGRVAAAAGKSGAVFDQRYVDIDLMGVPVCRAGITVPADERELLCRFEEPEVVITVSLGVGEAHARIWTCDLTHDYVTINGDYRT